MRGRIFSAQGAPPVGQEPVSPTPPEPVGKSRKKLYVVIAVIAVLAVDIVVVPMFFIPQTLGETIPYNYSYAVGQRLTYNFSLTVDMNGQQVVETGTISMHVVSFDGENYTIDETMHYDILGVSQNFSYTMVMNKAGQLVGYSNLPSGLQSSYSMVPGTPEYGLFLNRTDVRVGQTVQIPMSMANSSLSVSGTANFKISAVENVTVPWGAYKTFKIEISTSDVHVSVQGVDVSLSITGQMHMEYGTCHLIDLSMEEKGTASGMTMSLEMSITLTGDSIE